MWYKKALLWGDMTSLSTDDAELHLSPVLLEKSHGQVPLSFVSQEMTKATPSPYDLHKDSQMASLFTYDKVRHRPSKFLFFVL